jgi:putative ABC transport system substrate-binding protein
MRRRQAIRLLSAGGAGALAYAAHAQQRQRPVRVGYLSGGAPTEAALGWLRDAFIQKGWVEGQEYVLKTRFANLDLARFAVLTDELLRDGIDVLIAPGPAARMVPAVQHAVPVVFTVSSDPVASGLIRSLARPGGNATGNTQMMFELAGKRLELLREISPQARRAAVVQSPDHPGEEEERRQTLLWGERLGFEMFVRQVRNRTELQGALSELQAAACDSLLCFVDPVTLANRQLIVGHALQLRIPAVYPRRDFVEAGGLVSYGPNMIQLYARLVYFIERIAAGTPAGSLPVEIPTSLELIASPRAAAAIGIAIPPAILARADEVIE